MLQPRSWRPSFTSAMTAAEASLSNLASALNSLSLCAKHAPKFQPRFLPTNFTIVRNASHASQGRANGPKDSAGRRLGAKKSASEYVVPGNIIFKQRGTKWHPGENADIGKDHTIYALVTGYVRYYRNPLLHPKRRYIGVALEREGPMSKLPTPPNAPTRRRLGLYATPIKDGEGQVGADRVFLESHLSGNSKGTEPKTSTSAIAAGPAPTSAPAPTSLSTIPASAIQPIYRTTHRGALSYRESNVSIGRADIAKGVKVRDFDRGDRWMAWRKRAKKIKAVMLAKATKGNKKVKGKRGSKRDAKTGAKAGGKR